MVNGHGGEGCLILCTQKGGGEDDGRQVISGVRGEGGSRAGERLCLGSTDFSARSPGGGDVGPVQTQGIWMSRSRREVEAEGTPACLEDPHQ